MTNKELKNDIVVKALAREEKRKAMFSNYDYINWLVEFTEIYDSFIADDYEYRYLILKEKDSENLKNFYLFFNGIEKYANDNFVYPEYSQNGTYYKIKYNDIAFNIGIEAGQGTIMYCERTAPSEDDIEFANIMEGKKLPQKEIISNKLNKISNDIDELMQAGIPFNFILSELRKINEEKNNGYTRKKVK